MDALDGNAIAGELFADLRGGSASADSAQR
jgi:hypothetical protein